MNEIIRQQLLKCKVATVEDIGENKFHIKKEGNYTNQQTIYPGLNCNIEVEDYILHPYTGFTLHTNWNHDIIPKDKKMNVTILRVMGKMYYVASTGLETGNYWEGWLPAASIKFIT